MVNIYRWLLIDMNYLKGGSNMEDNLVFTFSGSAGCGKDLCAEMIKMYCESIDLKTFKLAFADAVKTHCMRNFGYADKTTDRHILQDFGTKIREIEKDYWAREVYTAIDAFRSLFDVFVISDARYENELSPYPYRLLYPIINVYVKRDFETTLGDKEYNHESEEMAHNPDLSKFHYVIDNNGTIEETYIQIAEMVNDVLDKKIKYLEEQRELDKAIKKESGESDDE